MFTGNYRITGHLGQGGMGVVYKAEHCFLDRVVAIKVLRQGKAEDETVRRRFEREARAAASISEHPDVVAVHRYGRLPDGTPFLVMRYVKGRTMEERLQAEGRLPLDHARQVLLSVASALAAAHEQGIVHRDVRPGNVLWDDDAQRGYLTDFGIAAVLATSGMDSSRITQTGQMVGDPRYLSPEQLQDRDLTEQSDIYGLGILGYELFTGEGPYQARSNADYIRAHLTQEPRGIRELRADVPADVADLLRRCMSKEPNHRPRAADVVRILQMGDGPPASEPASTTEGDLGELIKRRVPQLVLAVGAGGLTFVGLVLGLGDFYGWPPVTVSLALVLTVAAVLVSIVASWFHGEPGRQRSTAVEILLYTAIVVVWLGASWILWVTRG